MRLHILEHEANCGLGNIGEWLKKRGVEYHVTRFHLGEDAPELGADDALLVLGGSMNAYQDGDYPHLRDVRALTRAALLGEKRVLGICLGAQIMADALGGSVVRASRREIGWAGISRVANARPSPLLDWLPEEQPFVSWHGDTFALPQDAVLGAVSTWGLIQAFSWGQRALGVQFHPEANVDIVVGWILDEPEDVRGVLRNRFLPKTKLWREQKKSLGAMLDVWFS